MGKRRPSSDRKPRAPRKSIVEELLGAIRDGVQITGITQESHGAPPYPPGAVIQPTLRKLNRYDQL